MWYYFKHVGTFLKCSMNYIQSYVFIQSCLFLLLTGFEHLFQTWMSLPNRLWVHCGVPKKLWDWRELEKTSESVSSSSNPLAAHVKLSCRESSFFQYIWTGVVLLVKTTYQSVLCAFFFFFFFPSVFGPFYCSFFLVKGHCQNNKATLSKETQIIDFFFPLLPSLGSDWKVVWMQWLPCRIRERSPALQVSNDAQTLSVLQFYFGQTFICKN